MSKRRIREDVNQMPLTQYLSAVQKVDVTPDRAPLSVCDKKLIAHPEEICPIATETLSITTNSTVEDSNKK